MEDLLCISVTFPDAMFHGKCDFGQPEWPPSPLRLFQALVRGAAAASAGVTLTPESRATLSTLEGLAPPTIVAPRAARATPYDLFVPNNDSDAALERRERLVAKPVAPMRMDEPASVHYLWPLNHLVDRVASAEDFVAVLEFMSRRVVALGWGVDHAFARAHVLTRDEADSLAGERWLPILQKREPQSGLRTPIDGSLEDLERCHREFLKAVRPDRVERRREIQRFRKIAYHRADLPAQSHFAVFELRHQDGSFCAYPQRKLIHIAGMVRCLAGRLMEMDPPDDAPVDWADRYVYGHCPEGRRRVSHRQFSYLPLPSIGHEHADHAVRRVMIVAPPGDDAWLEHVADRLQGQHLTPEEPSPFGDRGAPTLVRRDSDRVIECYTQRASRWTTVTPVFLPGHDDHKANKRDQLVRRALAQSGIDQRCTWVSSAISQFRKSYSAHKYAIRDGVKQQAGYYRPEYLERFTAVHLTLTFHDDVSLPGPVRIGAGRHCGLGLLAPLV